jgi:hypothetical protein
VQRQDGSYAVIPHEALKQLTKHEQAINVHPAMKVVTSPVAQERPRVLAAVADRQRARGGAAVPRRRCRPDELHQRPRTLVALKRTDPEKYQEMRARTVGGGNYASAERVSRERSQRRISPGSRRRPHAASRTRRPSSRRRLRLVHAPGLQQPQRPAREPVPDRDAGTRAARSPADGDKVIKISAKAAEDAAKGLKNTDAQVELGRQVDRMYGQYQKFGPGLRNAISTYTPFVSWTINAVNFLYRVLPADHPVLTSPDRFGEHRDGGLPQEARPVPGLLRADAGQLPPWLQGSIPGKGGSHLRVSRYTPFGLLANDGGTPLGGLESLLLPQLSEITKNLSGTDWTGKKSRQDGDSGWRDILAAAASFVEGQIPLASQAANIAGKKLPNVADSTKVKKGVKVRARSTDPFMSEQAQHGRDCRRRTTS